MRIHVATPTYDGKLPIEVVRCLLNEQATAVMVGDDIRFQFLPGCSHPAMGRNQLAQTFMESDADRLVFLDSDVTFEPGAILKIARYQADFVGGAYRYKFPEENYPVGFLDGEMLGLTREGLVPVACVPGGFLSLSRKVFETFKEAFPEREYEHFGRKAFAYFHMTFKDGHLWGEDSGFCKEWRDLGGKVYLDPEIALTH